MRPLSLATVARAFLLSSLCLPGCSGGDGDSGDSGTQGGSSMTEGGSSKGGSPGKGGSSSMTEGGKSNPEGGKSNAGTSSMTEGGKEPMGGSGGSGNPPTGLDGNGITGTFSGVVHAHTFNPTNVPQQTETVVLMATSAMYPLYDAWTIRFMPELGEQDCTGDVGTEDTFITFGSQTNFELGGTTASGGSCKLNVTSLKPYAGTFSATLTMSSGPVDVTDGAFSVP